MPAFTALLYCITQGKRTAALSSSMQIQWPPPWPLSSPIFSKKSSQLACPENSPPGLIFLVLTVMHCLHKSYKNLYRRKVTRLWPVLGEILSSLGQTCGILTVMFPVFGRKKNQWLFLEVGILGRECSHSLTLWSMLWDPPISFTHSVTYAQNWGHAVWYLFKSAVEWYTDISQGD